MNGARQTIEATVLAWEGISSHPHRFGGREYRLETREIGHIHGDELVDVPLPKKVRDEMIAAGLAEHHHILPDSGWVSIWLRQPEDVKHAIAVLEKSWQLARAQQAKRSGLSRSDDSD